MVDARFRHLLRKIAVVLAGQAAGVRARPVMVLLGMGATPRVPPGCVLVSLSPHGLGILDAAFAAPWSFRIGRGASRVPPRCRSCSLGSIGGDIIDCLVRPDPVDRTPARKALLSMDLYRLLADTPHTLPQQADPPQPSEPPRPAPWPSPTTRITMTVETSDEERSGALLGSVAP